MLTRNKNIYGSHDILIAFSKMKVNKTTIEINARRQILIMFWAFWDKVYKMSSLQFSFFILLEMWKGLYISFNMTTITITIAIVLICPTSG